MKWLGRRQSGNVEDRRGGGGGRIPGGIITKGGLGTVIIIIIISLITGKNPLSLLEETGLGGNEYSVEQQNYTPTPEEEEMSQFVRVVLAETEDVWNKLMENYREPTLVLF